MTIALRGLTWPYRKCYTVWNIDHRHSHGLRPGSSLVKTINKDTKEGINYLRSRSRQTNSTSCCLCKSSAGLQAALKPFFAIEPWWGGGSGGGGGWGWHQGLWGFFDSLGNEGTVKKWQILLGKFEITPEPFRLADIPGFYGRSLKNSRWTN